MPLGALITLAGTIGSSASPFLPRIHAPTLGPVWRRVRPARIGCLFFGQRGEAVLHEGDHDLRDRQHPVTLMLLARAAFTGIAPRAAANCRPAQSGGAKDTAGIARLHLPIAAVSRSRLRGKAPDRPSR